MRPGKAGGLKRQVLRPYIKARLGQIHNKQMPVHRFAESSIIAGLNKPYRYYILYASIWGMCVTICPFESNIPKILFAIII